MFVEMIEIEIEEMRRIEGIVREANREALAQFKYCVQTHTTGNPWQEHRLDFYKKAMLESDEVLKMVEQKISEAEKKIKNA